MRLTIPQHQVTLSGNTAGALAALSSGRVTLAGGNNITLSQAGNAVTISGAAAAGAQTAISGLANSETTYTSGTVSLSELGAITIRSTTGQQFQLSVNPQSVQPETQTFIGGISASDTLYTSGTVRLTGVGGGITVSTNTGQRIDLSVAAQSVQPETQTFVGGVANSQTTYTSGTVSLSELGAITIRSTTGNQFQLSVNSQSVQPETQTFVAGIGNSQTTYSSGTVNLSVVAGNLTIRSTTGQAFQFSMSQTVQPETQTAISGIANSQTTYTSGTVSLSELGAITIRSTTGNQFQLSVNAQTTQTQGILSAGVSTGGNTAGNTTVNTGSRFVLVASGNATASQATAAGASTVTISVGTQTIQTQGVLSAGVSTGGNTAGNTTVNTGSRFVIVGSNGITASQGTAAGATTVTLSGITQSVQTQGVLSAGVSNVGNTSGDTTVNTGSRLVLAGGNNITLSQSTAAGATTITVSAPNLGAGAMSAGVSDLGNTAGSTGITGTQLVLVGSGVMSLSQSTGANGGTVSINAPATSSLSATGIVSISTNGSTISIGAPAFSGGFSTNGNTAGDTGYASQRLNLVGGNNITLSGSTNGGSMSVTISAGAGGGGGVNAGVSNLGNTAGSTGTVSTGNVVLVGSDNITLSQSTGAAGSAATVSIFAPASSSISGTGAVSVSVNGSTISIGAPNIATMADFQNFPQGEAVLMTNITAISKVPIYFNVKLPGSMTINTFAWKVSHVTNNTLQSLSAHIGIYTLVNSTSMALLGSWSESYVLSSATSVSFTGVRHYLATGIGTHTALSRLSGGHYAIGMMFSAGATQSMNMSLMGASTSNGPLGIIIPGVNQVSTGTSQGAMGLWGRGSTTVNALPSGVVASELVNQGSGASVLLEPWIYLRS